MLGGPSRAPRLSVFEPAVAAVVAPILLPLFSNPLMFLKKPQIFFGEVGSVGNFGSGGTLIFCGLFVGDVTEIGLYLLVVSLWYWVEEDYGELLILVLRYLF